MHADRRLLALLALITGLGTALGADAPAASASAHVAVLTANQVVQILDETVDWYRTLGVQQQNSSQPSDLLMLYANRQTADKVMALAFEIARANAELLSSEADIAPQSADPAASPQRLEQERQKLETQRKAIQSEMDAEHRELGSARGGQGELHAKLSEMQGELDMVNARENLLDTMTQFVGENDAKAARASALKAHIDAIADSIPAASTTAPVPINATPAVAAAAHPAALTLGSNSNDGQNRTGIWDLATNVLQLSRKLGIIATVDQRTAALEATFLQIRAAPLAQLKALSARGDALALQADNASSATLKSVRDEFDTLAWLFKQTSAILIPLSKEGVLLQQYRHNLGNWRDTIHHQYRDAMAALASRVGLLVAILAAVFVGAELWRRAVLRYAREAHRRHQLLLVRNIVTWTLVVAILAFTFVSELSSFATFAGLLTAGVAVAMQSVLVSLVGYFFLIGKYGIRVGDRVQIGTVSGEVIDLGLLRMHLIELNPQGPLGPTGRVVAFANSVVFQSSGGLFRQIPGVNFAWHELTLSLPAGCDYAAVKDKLLAAVSGVVRQYHDEIVRQTKEIQRSTSSSSTTDAMPQVQLRFAAVGVEALIRYPVQLKHAAEIDERVSQQLLNVMAACAAKLPRTT
ncbi:MAG TPA: mechanosensitive ion channel family protein [Steroidobacteraceae bacterium]